MNIERINEHIFVDIGLATCSARHTIAKSVKIECENAIDRDETYDILFTIGITMDGDGKKVGRGKRRRPERTIEKSKEKPKIDETDASAADEHSSKKKEDVEHCKRSCSSLAGCVQCVVVERTKTK